MSWLFPAFLAGAFAVTLPILLHFLRQRPRRTVPFPSFRFLAAANIQSEKRHRIQRWIVLLLRCAAIALLAAAFARPYIQHDIVGNQRAIVVVIDNSFSLQAKDRWPTTRDWAVREIGELHPGDKLGLLLMAPRPAWLFAPSTDTAAALAVLRALPAGWETARAESAVRLAADTLESIAASERRIIYLGDHQRLSWSGADFTKPLPSGVAISFPDIPAPVTRQAALAAVTLSSSAEGIHARLSLQNFTAAHARIVRVYSGSESAPVYSAKLALADHELRQLEFDLPAPKEANTGYRFTMDPDDLPADDTIYAIWETKAERTVILDAPPPHTADFLREALAASAAVGAPLNIQSAAAPSWPVGAVALLRSGNSFVGKDGARLDAFLAGGGSALIFVDGSEPQQQWLTRHGLAAHALVAKANPLRVMNWSMDHPIVTALTTQRVAPLLGWDFQSAWSLPMNAVEPIAQWSDDAAAIGEMSVGAGRILICGFAADRQSSDWPLHPAFVPFLHRAIIYLLGGAPAGVQRTPRVGESIALPSSTGTWRALDSPVAAPPVHITSGYVVPTAPGIYEFSSGPERKLFAVNLAPEESDLTPADAGAPWSGLVSKAPVPTRSTFTARMAMDAMAAERQQSFWWATLLIAAFLLLGELGLANRTRR